MSPMPWSRLKSSVRDRLAPGVRDRIGLHQARYRYTLEEVGRVWVTIDGREAIQFDTASYVTRLAQLSGELRAANGLRPYGDAGGNAAYLEADAAAAEILVREGKYDDSRALADLERYLSLSIDEALDSPTPLVRALAVMDKRVGKRRLRAMAPLDHEHWFVKEAYQLRCEVEKLRTTQGAE